MKESEGKAAICWRIVKSVVDLARLMYTEITYWFNMNRWKFCENRQVSSGQESNEARFCEHRCWQTRKSTHNKRCPRIPLVLLYFAINLIFFTFKENSQWCARRRSRRQQFRWKWLNIEISEVFNDQQTETLSPVRQHGPVSEDLVLQSGKFEWRYKKLESVLINWPIVWSWHLTDKVFRRLLTLSITIIQPLLPVLCLPAAGTWWIFKFRIQDKNKTGLRINEDKFCNQTPLKARQINLFCTCELLLKPQNRRHGHKEERRRPKREDGLLLSLVHIHTSSLATLNIFIWTERDFTITHIFSKLASLFLKKSQNCNYLICHTLSWGNSLIVSNWRCHVIENIFTSLEKSLNCS